MGSESSESQDEFEQKPYNEKITSSTVRSRRIPRGAVESVTISDWSVGGSNPVKNVFLCCFFLAFFFSFSFFMSVWRVLFFTNHIPADNTAGNNFRLNFLLNTSKKLTTMVAV